MGGEGEFGGVFELNVKKGEITYNSTGAALEGEGCNGVTFENLHRPSSNVQM
jgi:hypothetical protein